MIGRRRPAAAPESQPSPERISFRATVWAGSYKPVPELRRGALSQAGKFFGSDYDLAITEPWTAAEAPAAGYHAEITVTATPRSEK